MQPFNALRIMTVAFLFNGDDILLLERSASKKIYPNLWSGVGGHVEPNELGDIKLSCLREIHEETNIPPEHITTLDHRYLVLRHKGTELWQTEHQHRHNNPAQFHQTHEGVLHWILRLRSLQPPTFIPVNIAALRHYFTTQPQTVHLGLAHPADPHTISTWHPVVPTP